MPNIVELPQFTETITQLDLTDFVVGGSTGIANKQSKELGDRTKYLKEDIQRYKEFFLQTIPHLGEINTFHRPISLEFYGDVVGSTTLNGNSTSVLENQVPEVLNVGDVDSGSMPNTPHEKFGPVHFFAEMLRSHSLTMKYCEYLRYDGQHQADLTKKYGGHPIVGTCLKPSSVYDPIQYDGKVKANRSHQYGYRSVRKHSLNYKTDWGFLLSTNGVEAFGNAVVEVKPIDRVEDTGHITPYETTNKLEVSNMNVDSGFIHKVEFENHRHYALIFEAKFPETVELVIDTRNPDGQYATHYWMSNRVGTGKIETYVVIVTTGEFKDGAFRYDGEFFLDGTAPYSQFRDVVGKYGVAIKTRTRQSESDKMYIYDLSTYDLDNHDLYSLIASRLGYHPLSVNGDQMLGSLTIPVVNPSDDPMTLISLDYLNRMMRTIPNDPSDELLDTIDDRLRDLQILIEKEQFKLNNMETTLDSLDITPCTRKCLPPPPTGEDRRILDFIAMDPSSCQNGAMPTTIQDMVRAGKAMSHINCSWVADETCYVKVTVRIPHEVVLGWYLVVSGQTVNFGNNFYSGNRYSCGVGLYIGGSLVWETGPDAVMCWDAFYQMSVSAVKTTCPLSKYEETVYNGASSIQPMTSVDYTCSEPAYYRVSIIGGQGWASGWLPLNTGDKITSSNPYYRGNRYDCGVIVRVNNTMLIDTGASSLMCWDSFGPQLLMIQKAIIS